jgi:hypothetical protein
MLRSATRSVTRAAPGGTRRRNFVPAIASAIARVVASVVTLIVAWPAPARAGRNVFSVSGDRVTFNGQPFKVIGLRLSNALISDAETGELIDNLDTFKAHGVNTVSVFFMGSRFGDVKGYRPDASLDPTYSERMARIIEAADARGMIVLVGCLYWSTSRANDDLGAWTQQQANLAVANTIRWIVARGYRNVFVDVDNEGMAHDATGWSIASMIDAAHAVDRTVMVAYNDAAAPPTNADLYIHHSPRVAGKPWIESEGSAPETPGGYWGSYSKEDGYYNYLRIGRYTAAMKAAQIAIARRTINEANGYMLASTWLQAAPSEGIGGPFMNPGGRSEIASVDADVKRLHPDAGVRWWLEAMRVAYGPWSAPNAAASDAAVDARRDGGAAGTGGSGGAPGGAGGDARAPVGGAGGASGAGGRPGSDGSAGGAGQRPGAGGSPESADDPRDGAPPGARPGSTAAGGGGLTASSKDAGGGGAFGAAQGERGAGSGGEAAGDRGRPSGCSCRIGQGSPARGSEGDGGAIALAAVVAAGAPVAFRRARRARP